MEAIGTILAVPAAGDCDVAFWLERPEDVQLTLYDVTGREVAAVKAGPCSSGLGLAKLDLHGVSPGVYILRLRAAGSFAQRKLVVAR